MITEEQQQQADGSGRDFRTFFEYLVFSTAGAAFKRNEHFAILADPRLDETASTYRVLISCTANDNPWMSWDRLPLVVTPRGESTDPVSVVWLNKRGQAIVRNLPKGDYRLTFPKQWLCGIAPGVQVRGRAERHEQVEVLVVGRHRADAAGPGSEVVSRLRCSDQSVSARAEQHPDGSLSLFIESKDQKLADAAVRFVLVKATGETVSSGEAKLTRHRDPSVWTAVWQGRSTKDQPAELSLFALLVQSEPEFDLHRLPIPTAALVGRTAELNLLDQLLDDPGVPVVTVRAAGGIGKSALLDEWLNRQALQAYGGAQRVFGYSFYNQSTHTTYTSSTDFFDAALPFFGYEGDLPIDDVDKALALANLLRKRRSILVLDGVEPLQHKPAEERGWFADAAMRALLRELARSGLPAGGLVLVSSRQPIEELAAYLGGRYREIGLKQLCPHEGAALLRNLGVQGHDQELERATDEWGGHALALVLLGGLLVDACNGDVACRDMLPGLTAAPDEGGHARRVMRYYDEIYWPTGAPERRMLHLLGLLDRPMTVEERDVLLRDAVAAQGLPTPNNPGWIQIESRLEKAGLLLTAKRGTTREMWDTHPLIREYFGQRLREKKPDVYRQAHRVLVKHFSGCAPENLSKLMKLERLYCAVHHACKAGDYQQAMAIRSEQILGKENEPLKQGAFAMDLAALAGFFENSWSTPIASNDETGLSPADRMKLLGSAAYDLASMGRLSEAISSRMAQRSLAIDLHNPCQAVDASENLVDLMLLTGELNKARMIAHEGLRQAKETGRDFQRMIMQVQYGAVLYRQGYLDDSLAAFQEAERLHVRFDKTLQGLDTLHSARYCALLLEMARDHKDVLKVMKRAAAGYEIARADDKIMEMSLNRMMQGLCHAALGQSYLADEALKDAVRDMRNARKIDFMPRVLLARAKLMAVIGNSEGGHRYLQEVREIADWCGMDLYRIEAMLLEANLQLDSWRINRSRKPQCRAPTGGGNTTDPLDYAETIFRQVSDLIDKTDYGLRRPELLLLQARISFYRADREQALMALDEARKRVASAGRYGLQGSLETVAEELAKPDRNLSPVSPENSLRQ